MNYYPKTLHDVSTVEEYQVLTGPPTEGLMWLVRAVLVIAREVARLKLAASLARLR